MDILFICPNVPCSLKFGNGVAQRNYMFIKRLSKKHRIWLLAFYSNEKEKAHINELKKYCVYVKAIPKKINIFSLMVKAIKSIFFPPPLRVSLWYLAEMKKNLVEIISKNKFDVIHISSILMTCYIKNLINLPVIVDFIDSKSLYIKREISSSFKRFLIIPKIENQQILHYEKKVIKMVKNCIYISRIDRDYILKYLDSNFNIYIVPNGFWEIDKVFYNKEKIINSVSFVGDMSYLPNISAMKYFCREIFPLVQKKIPNVRLYIIGKNPTKFVKSFSRYENIIVTGTVDDVYKYLIKTNVFVCPTKIGSGMNTKILEAMIAGVPVIATSKANEGIWAHDNKEILLADNPTDFASNIIKLLSDKKLSNYIVDNAKKLIKSNFNWENIIKELENIYLKLAL